MTDTTAAPKNTRPREYLQTLHDQLSEAVAKVGEFVPTHHGATRPADERQLRNRLENIDRLRQEIAEVKADLSHYTFSVHVVIDKGAVNDTDDAIDWVASLLGDNSDVLDYVYLRNGEGEYAYPRPAVIEPHAGEEDSEWIYRCATAPFILPGQPQEPTEGAHA